MFTSIKAAHILCLRSLLGRALSYRGMSSLTCWYEDMAVSRWTVGAALLFDFELLHDDICVYLVWLLQREESVCSVEEFCCCLGSADASGFRFIIFDDNMTLVTTN